MGIFFILKPTIRLAGTAKEEKLVVITNNSAYVIDEAEKKISGGSIARLFGVNEVAYSFIGTKMENGAIYQGFFTGGKLFAVTADGKQFNTSRIEGVRQ